MCVIFYKPLNVAFPEEATLRNCFDNNPDGAGFMYAWNGNVHFQKGYDNFESFNKALNKARKLTGDNIPYVCHFRIATQGYEKTMTHPFPLSSNMDKLKKLKGDCNICVAHNGILELTSDGSKEYSDTMKFITDYLSLIIRSYDWHKDERTKLLIERLIKGSRLAILDKNGHCELCGEGWVEDNGIFYSNSSYKSYFARCAWEDEDYWDDWVWDKKLHRWVYEEPEYTDPYDKYYNKKTNSYDFRETNCPVTQENNNSYCFMCENRHCCAYNLDGLRDDYDEGYNDYNDTPIGLSGVRRIG